MKRGRSAQWGSHGLPSGSGGLGNCVVATAAEVGLSPRCEAEATVSNGLTIVVCRDLPVRQNGGATIYSSTTGARQASATTTKQCPTLSIEHDIVSGKFALICVTPERAVSPDFVSLLANTRVHQVIIDKAVIGRLWGCYLPEHHNFINEVAALFPGAGPAVFRAVQGRYVLADQAHDFALSDVTVAVTDIARWHLDYRVEQRSNMPLAQLVEWLHCRKSWAGAVYCMDRTEADEVADLLEWLGFRAVCYHQGLSQSKRESAAAEFNSRHVDIAVVPTGQGEWIDRSDMHFVLHTRMPSSIGAYLQDTRIADRGETRPKCVIFYSREDVKAWCSRPSQAQGLSSATRSGLNDMQAYCLTSGCRHLEIMKQLKPGYVPPSRLEFYCRCCDNCLNEPLACFGDQVSPEYG